MATNYNEKYSEMLELIRAWAAQREDIRALAVIGSRSSQEKSPDQYSDLDLLLVTDSFMDYFTKTAWLSEIGPYWFTFTESVPSENFWERRALFEGGLDVDFVLVDYTKLRTSPDSLTIVREICDKTPAVILDKDGISENLIRLKNTHRKFSFPLKEEFENLTGDFYFHTAWASKKIMRGEHWVAYRCVNGYLKSLLLKMAEWYGHALNGIEYNTWYDGRYFEKWADAEIQNRIAGTFSAYNPLEMKKAVISSAALFTTMARKVSAEAELPFPEKQEAALREWIGDFNGNS